MDKKSEEKVFRGIHYIRVSQLPHEQKDMFMKWLPRDQIIKIQIEQDILPDCVQYHHYEHWFDNIMLTMMVEENGEFTQNPDIGISVQ